MSGSLQNSPLSPAGRNTCGAFLLPKKSPIMKKSVLSTDVGKVYSSAPLPFAGQKRFFLKEFRNVLKQNITDNGEGWTIVDVFGGSGLLAHYAKRLFPHARVIFNDFDHYADRLKNIDHTNELLDSVRRMVMGYDRDKRLPDDVADNIRHKFKEHDGFFDLRTIETNVLFSGNSVKSKDELTASRGEKGHRTFYNTVVAKNYEADGYLDGLEITRRDYLDLLKEFAGQEKTLLILDPPYINTDQSRYKTYEPFGLGAFLRLMKAIKPPFIFFSSEKSEFADYVEVLKETEDCDYNALFAKAKWYTRRQGISGNNLPYLDSMVSLF